MGAMAPTHCKVSLNFSTAPSEKTLQKTSAHNTHRIVARGKAGNDKRAGYQRYCAQVTGTQLP